jgi:hypothetical protein
MTWSNPLFDGSAAPHYYTTCYDDRGAGKVTRYIDGREIYAATWKWNEALGGTGHGPDAVAILNLAVGGRWTGNLVTLDAIAVIWIFIQSITTARDLQVARRLHLSPRPRAAGIPLAKLSPLQR